MFHSQVIRGMIENPVPTRAEVSDLMSLAYDWPPESVPNPPSWTFITVDCPGDDLVEQ